MIVVKDLLQDLEKGNRVDEVLKDNFKNKKSLQDDIWTFNFPPPTFTPGQVYPITAVGDWIGSGGSGSSAHLGTAT